MKNKSRDSLRHTAEHQRRTILNAILAHVPFDGWTEAAWKSGIRQCSITPGEAELLFPRGLRDVMDLFGAATDEAMLARIQKEHGFVGFRVRDKIAFAVRARLEFLMPHREALRRLMIWYAMPLHWPLGAKRLYRTVDLAWRAAGDTSTDFNFYTKRGLLAGVVKATTLFWLDDDTPGCRASWAFLDRRIAEVLQAGQTIGKLKSRLFATG
jgi:ubiquinone biosynthesis protein COQ9